MPPGPGVASGMTEAMKESPTPQHRGRWYEDVGNGKVKRPRPVRTECCDSVRPDVSNLTKPFSSNGCWASEFWLCNLRVIYPAPACSASLTYSYRAPFPRFHLLRERVGSLSMGNCGLLYGLRCFIRLECMPDLLKFVTNAVASYRDVTEM
jgi:hypothetical protein